MDHNHRHSHSCRDEHHEHHHHDDHGEHHDHDHDDHIKPDEIAVEQTLYPCIDIDHVRCLNEHENGAGKSVFKPYSERLSSKFVESSVDSELLFHIPFTVSVKIKSIGLIGGHDNGPTIMKVFKNRNDLEIDDAESTTPDQIFDSVISHDEKGDVVYYHVKPVKFQNVNHLVLYFPQNMSQGDLKTKIQYIAIRGESTNYKRQIVKTVYESKPQLSDHEVPTANILPHIQ